MPMEPDEAPQFRGAFAYHVYAEPHIRSSRYLKSDRGRDGNDRVHRDGKPLVQAGAAPSTVVIKPRGRMMRLRGRPNEEVLINKPQGSMPPERCWIMHFPRVLIPLFFLHLAGSGEGRLRAPGHKLSKT